MNSSYRSLQKMSVLRNEFIYERTANRKLGKFSDSNVTTIKIKLHEGTFQDERGKNWSTHFVSALNSRVFPLQPIFE